MNKPVLLLIAAAMAAAEVKTYESTLTIPTYEHSGRESEPPLFGNSTVTGLYPFTTFLMPFREGGPTPKTYRAIILENEYLKLTYIPEFGGRFYSLFDKIRGREALYRNDVIKPAPYNPRLSWPQSGMELTGPYDVHMLTLHGEPFWSNKIVRNADGSISLVLGEIDPVYQMNVNFSATLYPGVAALEINISCYNPRDARMPQMFWTNTAVAATPGTRFLYPMTRTVGHTTADIADWPLYNGVDYSWDRNNQHMLGVFGIDIYDNFQGAYQFDTGYGVFRWADRRNVQGMKMWTFGYGPGSKDHERGYTDSAGPYVELQSGRHVWDGHYEWVAPHRIESWSEWWIPVAGTNGLTTMTRDVALNVQADGASVGVTLAATRVVKGVRLVVRSRSGELGAETVDLDPAAAKKSTFRLAGSDGSGLRVVVNGPDGATLLDYLRPDTGPGRREYTPFTRPLEQPRKQVEEMGAEELVFAAEYRFKELDSAGARALLDRALKLDPGHSRAHLLFGVDAFQSGRHAASIASLEKAIGRDPYLAEAYYYLAMSQFASGRDPEAERNLYFIWPDSMYFGLREYHLGRLSLIRKKYEPALDHLRRSILANGMDLSARMALAVAYRESGSPEGDAVLSEVERLDPSNRLAAAERMFRGGDPRARTEVIRLLGGQSQEAISLSLFYRGLERWKDAVTVLLLVQQNNQDPWGTPAEYYYTLAYCQRRAGDVAEAARTLDKAGAAPAHIDRFPYRRESEAPLAEAVAARPRDVVARGLLARLLYSLNRPKEAIVQWEAALEQAPDSFSFRRELGLAYAEQGYPVERAAAHLERAVALRPSHLRTVNDLSAVYARSGRFQEQLTLLERSLAQAPADADLAEAVFTAYLIQGQYEQAEQMIAARRFAVHHRSYGLRNKYRVLRYALGARAFNRGDYREALALFESARKPPVRLGVDDFASQESPRIDYSIGRTLEALARNTEAGDAYRRAIAGIAQLSGDRDSWNSENFFMVLALDRLKRAGEATKLQGRFENFARSERDSRNAAHRAEANYLLGLARKRDSKPQESLALMKESLEVQPDLLFPRLEIRGDVLDPLGRPQR